MNNTKDHFNAQQVVINEIMNDYKMEIMANEGLTNMVKSLRNERDEIQGRLQAIDHAYANSQQTNKAAGEEIRRLKAENAEMACKLDAAFFINDRMKAVQKSVCDWLVTDGIRARVAIQRIVAAVDNDKICDAQMVLATDKSE